jgi:tRNA/rRNA methyltransferase
MASVSAKTTDIFFILVEPVYRGNIGAAARVINNFGFTNLRLVGAIPKKEDHYLAVHSEEIMNRIEIFDDLKGALSDMDAAIAVTRRSGRKKKSDLNSDGIKKFVAELHRGRTAFVFGRETYGLKDEEIELCPIRCFIPTSEEFPSLNLAQAVAIVAYELFDHSHSGDTEAEKSLAGSNKINDSVNDILKNLTNIGYFETGDPGRTEKQLQNILLRSYTTEENLLFLAKLFQRIEVLFSKKK